MYISDDKLKEECGVFGIFSTKDEASVKVYYGLYALQHRGQESAGIVTSNGKEMFIHKEMGLVSEVFDEDKLKKLHGKLAIGHVRYSTTGGSNAVNAQPILGTSKLGPIAIAHNGNLVNVNVIRELLEDTGSLFQTSIDSEVILNLIARGAKKGLEKAVVDAISTVKGSYGMVILTEDKLIGVRDPNGIRPLCIGKTEDSYILSSESCGIDAVGGDFIRDLEPGELVIIDKDGIETVNFAEKTRKSTCSFEYIYFARPDSIMDGINVYEARFRAGEILYKEEPAAADIVIGVPDSGIPAAMGYSKASGIPYGIGLVKNRYVGRTFISPTQDEREKAVSVKLNALKVNVENKRVVLIDDSIVRGTTSRRLVEILKKAGASEVHFRSSSPIVKYPCYFGIDTPYRRDLIGSEKSTDEIKNIIGADTLGYLSMEGLKSALDNTRSFCVGCFNGIYPLPAPMEQEKELLER